MEWHKRTKVADKPDRKRPEWNWVEDRRPFYNVWPCVAAGLSRVRFDIPEDAVLPLLRNMPSAVSVRLPIGNEISSGSVLLKEFLVLTEQQEDQPHTRPECRWDRQTQVMQCCLSTGDHPFMFMVYEDNANRRNFVKQNPNIPANLEGQVRFWSDRLTNRSQDELRLMETAVRIYLGIAMLHDNPDMVEAVVLRKDRDKYAETRDPKYVEKAKRRGEHGWNIGANIEVLPHFRRPHFAIRWTGKGGEVPKLVPVQGCVVKRSKFSDVPTGYQADEE